ncbi:MAG: flagellar export chaperone FlgN [Magnetococcales bacterium]|nr:flagellar export chaperone FlgN [Magnetococcales bacterium]
MSEVEFDQSSEVQRLQQVLEPLIELFGKLRLLLLEEREALNSRKPEVLEVASENIRATLEEIYKTDKLRQRLTARLGTHLGLSADKQNLKNLDEALGGGSGFIKYRERLTTAIQSAEVLNKENQAVFTGVLTATESMLKILKESTQGPISSYNRLGNRQTAANFHFLSKQF